VKQIRSLNRLLRPFKRSLETHLFYAGNQSVGLHSQKLRGSVNAFDSSSTAKRLSRSRRRTSDSVRYSGSTSSPSRVANEVRPVEESVPVRSNSKAPPRAKMAARSMTFRSSRILPGQSQLWSVSTPARVSPLRWACLADATHENCATRLEVESALTQGLRLRRCQRK
jgi:hypothetical protein